MVNMVEINLTKDNKEAGKLKHGRIIKITTAMLTFMGVLIAGLFLYNTTIENALINETLRVTGIFSLIALAIFYTVYQNSALASLERTLGWTEDLNEKKLSKPRKVFAKLINRLEKSPEKVDQLLNSSFSSLILLGGGLFMLITFTPEKIGWIFYLAVGVPLFGGFFVLWIAFSDFKKLMAD